MVCPYKPIRPQGVHLYLPDALHKVHKSGDNGLTVDFLSFQHIPLNSIYKIWAEADASFRPPPWQVPPQGLERGLLIITHSYYIHIIPGYQELYRIMLRDGSLKFVYPNGREEIIIEAYVWRTNLGLVAPTSSNTVKGQPESLPSNVLPFKRPRRGD